MTKIRNWCSKHRIAIPLVLTLLIAFMDVFGFPLAPLIKIEAADINPIYFALIGNQIFAILLCLALVKLLYPKWPLYLGTAGLWKGVKSFGILVAVSAIIAFAAFYLGLNPFDNSPTAMRVIIESVIYNISLAIIEELYVRGLLQNTLRGAFAKSRRGALYAVLLSSAIFGVGHIPGSIGQPVLVVIGQVLWTFGLGVFLGAVYTKTKNLWCAVLFHFAFNLAGVLYCFTTQTGYPTISLAILIPLFVLLGVYGAVSLAKESKTAELRQ
ncbi:MAG: CPBP family intramembrane metalloprotease [Oscillospiraceae bacterium]|jgi:membrane protease YdiL (CAAX protease family)|nr:CPBP family intramembrane metalloprotease [Oscillospiraceae bacterium]